MGVDGRLFRPQVAAFAFAETPAWREPEPRESLAHYAVRMAESVLAQDRADARPIVVGGLSLGGMVALEMSRHLPAACVVLIASCRESDAVARLLKLAEFAARGIPLDVVERAKGLAPPFLGRGGAGGGPGRVPPADRALLGEMLATIPASFLRWAGRAIMEWPGATDVRIPVHHIHGDRDWVIPLSRVRRTRPPLEIEVVAGGPHVLNLSHPGEVNAALARALAGAGRGD